MQVSREQFMEQGYLVLREVIPPDRLERLRAEFETLVGRQRKIWAQERGPDDPPGGVWETQPQPRLVSYDRLIDEATAGTVEVWLQESTLGVSRQLLSVPEAAAVAGMMLMCSPARDHGPAAWHRDIHPIDMAPLAGLQKDLKENGPKYVQWNIPLYDDNVLWVVPGSHLRLNTEAENRSLSADPRRAVPGGVPVKLRAGDAVVYINYLLHWGSNYSAATRRTIHGGHTIFPYYPDISFTDYLSPGARADFRQWDGKSAALQDLTEIALREALNGNAGAYFNALEALQPGVGEDGKMVLTIYLCKAVLHLQVVKHENADTDADSDPLEGITEDYRQRARSSHSISINWGPQFAQRFTVDEAAALHRRFAILDGKLQAEDERFAPGFQARPMRYFFNEMPADFTLQDFIGSWN